MTIENLIETHAKKWDAFRAAFSYKDASPEHVIEVFDSMACVGRPQVFRISRGHVPLIVWWRLK